MHSVVYTVKNLLFAEQVSVYPNTVYAIKQNSADIYRSIALERCQND
ncbi:hypothetical protein PRUB_a0489 [Pseudoalteromonas rubra]|uniref:Uncharacterized protein n=1 Tax=Pseudoalteromonas rubra TaxID=43658 RepID=A0A8T0C5K9_9GAMM|nr:hypothetical protein PRUB_a0489 [Pseudoalteromonas rubra]